MNIHKPIIIKEEKLMTTIEKHNLKPLKVTNHNIANQILLETENIEGFLTHAKEVGSTHIYYNYIYYDPDNYIIPNDWFDEQYDNIQNAVNGHNQTIKSLDFGSPKKLSLFILMDGAIIGMTYHNPWITDENIQAAEITMDIIESKYDAEYRESLKAKRSSRKTDEEELRKIIYKDPDFRFCKNQELRYHFLIDLLEENEKANEYNYLVEPYGAPFAGKVKMFMDKTWMMYNEK